MKYYLLYRGEHIFTKLLVYAEQTRCLKMVLIKYVYAYIGYSFM